jgi:hypothetical protein
MVFCSQFNSINENKWFCRYSLIYSSIFLPYYGTDSSRCEGVLKNKCYQQTNLFIETTNNCFKANKPVMKCGMSKLAWRKIAHIKCENFSVRNVVLWSMHHRSIIIANLHHRVLLGKLLSWSPGRIRTYYFAIGWQLSDRAREVNCWKTLKWDESTARIYRKVQRKWKWQA